MATSKTIRKFKLKLTTITPVSVGGDQGNALSPYADYVFGEDNKSLLYLNQRAIVAAMQGDNGLVDNDLMDRYVEGVGAGMDNNRSNFSLRNFLTKDLKLELQVGKPVVQGDQVPVYGLEPNMKLQITPIAKSAGQPYLPGSSIKGAIRTAILYYWLIKRKDDKTSPLLKNLQNLLKEIDKIKARNPNFRRMSFSDRKELQELERKIFPEELLLGSFRSKFGPDGRRIRLTDSNILDTPPEVHYLRRIRLTPAPERQPSKYGSNNSKSEIPIIREAMQPQHSLEATLTVLPGFDSPELRYWEKDDANGLLKVLNEFTMACLENELFELKRADDPKFRSECQHLLDFYTNLLNRAEAGETFLRLGFGKTIYDNSLSLSMLNGIENEDESFDAFDLFRFNFWKVGRSIGRYPATRTVTQDGRPMGWVKVEMEEIK